MCGRRTAGRHDTCLNKEGKQREQAKMVKKSASNIRARDVNGLGTCCQSAQSTSFFAFSVDTVGVATVRLELELKLGILCCCHS